MDFLEFKNKFFSGEAEKAVECIISERETGFKLIEGFSQSYEIISTFTSEEKELYQRLYKQYRKEHKYILKKEDVLNSMNDYLKKRNGLSIFLGIPTILGLFLYIPFFFIMLIAYIPLLIWIVKKNRQLNAIRNNDFYIVKQQYTYKNVKTSTVDWSDVDTYEIYFPGFDGYKVTKHEYESIEYGNEYFLIVPKYNPKKIINIFNADIYDLSDEFYITGDKYLFKR